jgi:hypothetical protein
MLKVASILMLAGSLACMPAAAVAQSTTPGQGARAPRAALDPRAETLNKLQRRVTVEITDQRLEDVVKFIADFSGANIDAIWNDAGAEGLDKERRVSISVKDVACLTMLELLLARTGDEFSGNSWQMAESGEIQIGPRSQLNKAATLKIYDVQDLLFEVPSFTNVPQLDLEQVLSQSSGGGGGGGNVIQGADPEVQSLTERELSDKLVNIITNNIERDQWTRNGGDGASIDVHAGTLLVRAPDYIHRQLVGYSYWNGASGAASSAVAGEYRAELNAREAAKRAAVAKATEEYIRRKAEEDKIASPK